MVNLINIQGLTKQKLTVLEQMFNSTCDVLCLTETRQRYDRLDVDKNLIKLENMRKGQDKKGGGLMVIYKSNNNIKFDVIPSRNADILDVQGTIAANEIRIILVYMSVESQPQDLERNRDLQRELECKIESNEDRALLVMGDFNGHVGFLGDQREDRNGKFVMNLVNSSNMVMLNCDDKCKGMYTWGKRGQRSVIDYVLANDRMYQHLDTMEIDEYQEACDLSDHNLISISFMFEACTNFSKASREDQYYLRVDEQSLKLFAEEMQVRMEGRSITNIEEFNATMKSVAEEKLEARYRRRLINKQEKVKEKPWVTEQVRREIKKRKSLDREKRNVNTEEEKEKLYDEYQKQKEVTKLLVKEEISKHEIKVTEEIRQSACKSKALWENISKLRGKPVAKHTEIHLFTEEGKPMEEQDEENAFLDFWEKVYQKHDNRIDVVWNRETRQRYISELENQHEAL